MKSNIVGELTIENKNIVVLESAKGKVLSISENKRSLLIKLDDGTEKEIYSDSKNISTLNGNDIVCYHLYNKEKGIIAKDSIITDSSKKIFNKEMINSFFELVFSPVRTKEYSTGIFSLILFSVCLFLYLSDLLKFSYNFTEVFHANLLGILGVMIFLYNVILTKQNNNKKKNAMKDFIDKIVNTDLCKIKESTDISLSKELVLKDKRFEILSGKAFFVKSNTFVEDKYDVTRTEEEKVSETYNPITNTTTIYYKENTVVLSSHNTTHYNLFDENDKVKRVGVLSLDFNDNEEIRLYDLKDNTGKIYSNKVIERKGVYSYVNWVNGNSLTENHLIKIFKIPFFNMKLLTMLFFIYFCYNYFTNDVRGAAMSMLIYFVLLILKLVYKFYELNKKDQLDYDMKVFCHKIRNNL